jgi:hypothetical protein
MWIGGRCSDSRGTNDGVEGKKEETAKTAIPQAIDLVSREVVLVELV